MVLFYPLKISIKAHTAISTGKIQIDVKLFGLSVVRVRLNVFDGIVMINGKRYKKHPKKRINFAQTLRYFTSNKFLRSEKVCVVYRLDDEKNNAIIKAMLLMLPNISNIYCFEHDNNACMEMQAVIRMNLMQMTKALVIANG